MYCQKSPKPSSATPLDHPESSKALSRQAVPWLVPSSRYRQAAPVLDAAWRLIGGALVGTLAGYLVDRAGGSAPWGLLVGAIVGIFAGFGGLFQGLRRWR